MRNVLSVLHAASADTSITPVERSSKLCRHGHFASADTSVTPSKRFFEIARSIGDRALVDKARVYLGIARGNSMLPKYLDVVTHDLDALLRWKTRRVAFAS